MISGEKQSHSVPPGDEMIFHIRGPASQRLTVRTACGAEIEVELPPGASLKITGGRQELDVILSGAAPGGLVGV